MFRLDKNISYTKSVSPRSCDTGWNTRARRRIPSRHAESSELANTRPAHKASVSGGGGGGVEQQAATPLTAFVAVGQFLGDPLDGFGSDLGAEVPVEG